MTSIGFIGLGVMGRPMAANLLEAGHDLVVYNPSPAAVQELVGRGEKAAGNPAVVAGQAEVVMIMVPDSPQVEEVMLGEDGVLSTAADGQLVIDLSSIAPASAASIAEQARERGVRFLDAPVSGGEQGAIDGTLSIMVGGEAADFDAAKSLLDVLGKTVVHVGPPGAGQTVKLANQMLVGGIIELVSEAFVLLEASGVDLAAAVQVLAGGLAGNAILDKKAAGMLAHEFDPGFRIDLHHKDLTNALAAARDLGVAVPVTAVVAQLLIALRAMGRGGLDHTAVLTLIEDLSGRGR
ncbi:MAG: 2-hydroxy-3-oxopropionate reductase [Streptosporangiaceae bacterium]